MRGFFLSVICTGWPLWERACSRWHRRRSTALPRRQHREQARSHRIWGASQTGKYPCPARPASSPGGQC
ncbi:hypothetical protein C7A07_22865 [Pseudomonas fragi]|nr:hypothetical protein C7A07_22865 [Pseudomonas fragi]